MEFDKWTELRNAVQSYVDLGEIQFMPILDKMDSLQAEEARLKPPAPTLKPGDKVRHKTHGYIGRIDKVAASGLRARVAWDNKYWPASYIEFRNLELVEEAPQS